MEPILISFLILLFATLNMLPLLSSLFHIPPGDVFIGIPHWYEDYFYYLSIIKQGQEGLWQAMNWYTLEPIPPGPGYWCYLFLGKINMLFGLEPWTLYNGTLFISTIIFLLLTYLVIRQLIPRHRTLRIIAFVMALSATAFVGPTGPVTFFFTPTLSLNRLGGSIHQAWVNCFSLLFFLLIVKWFRTYSIKMLLLSLLVQILLCSLNPAASMITLLSAGLAWSIPAFLKSSIKNSDRFFLWNRKHMLPSILLVLVFLLFMTALFVSYLTVVKHPYYQYTLLTYSKYFVRATPITFILSMGSIALFASMGIPQWIKERKPLELVGLLYITIPIFLYFSPLPGLFNLPYERLLQPAMYAFLGALGACGIAAGSRILFIRFGIKQSFGITLLFLIFLIFSSIGLVAELESRFKNFQDVYFLNTINRSLYQGLSKLGDEPYGAVFAPYMTSILTPVISGKPVYSAHRTLTIDYEKKMKDSDEFLSLLWNEAQAQAFFSSHGIRYIVIPYGSDVQGRIQAHYPFLKPLFSNAAVTYYRIEN